MTNATFRTTLAAVAALIAFIALAYRDIRASESHAPPAAVIARQQLRVEAAHASLGAKPVIGKSHLPPYDAAAAIAREENESRRLSLRLTLSSSTSRFHD